MSRKTFSRFIAKLLAEISGNLRETCQLIKENLTSAERIQAIYRTNTWLRAINYQIAPINNKVINTYSIFY